MDTKKDVFANPKDKWDFIIAVIVIVLFSVFIWVFLLKSDKKIVENNAVEPSVEYATLVNKEKASTSSNANSTAYQRKKIKIEDAYLTEQDSAIIITDVVKSKLDEIKSVSKSLPINDKSITSSEVEVNNDTNIQEELIETVEETTVEAKSDIVTQESQIEEEKEIIEKVSNEIVTEEPSLEIKEELSIESNNDIVTKEVSIEEEPSVEVEDTTISQEESIIKEEVVTTPEVENIEVKEELKATNKNYDCVIIVGAFKEASNKIAIINKLTSLGYAHSDGVLRKGLNYVGVPVACNDKQEKQRLLRELNEAFEIESWVKKI